MKPIVLASASPRRLELLRNAGIEAEVQPAQVPEFPASGEDPAQYALRLAREKARAVFTHRPGDAVLGADTIVLVGAELLEKPKDTEDAARMLRLLSGRSHQVSTAICLIGKGFEDNHIEHTTVWFDKLTEEDIRWYVASGEPMDKAGAYAIQGLASRFIPRIEGDYSNVVGLPVARVCAMLRAHGLL